MNLNPFEIAKEEIESLKRRLKTTQAYKDIFTQEPNGRIVLHDIVRRAGLFAVSSTDHGKLAFNEGRRSLALEILSMLRMDTEAAMLKLLEERQRDNREEE